jgi:hypothetical protein
MSTRIKKLIAAITFVAFSLFYFFVTVTIAWVRLPGTSALTQLAFYFVMTLVWFLFAAAIIYWMQRLPRDNRTI